MNDETIVAVYDTAAHAEAAVAALKAAGVPAEAISVNAGSGGITSTTELQPVREQGFWSSLFGGEPDHDTAVYDRSIEAGATVVSVKAAQTRVARIVEILEGQNPVDIDERATTYGIAQATGRTSAPTPAAPMTAPVAARSGTLATGTEETLRLAEETLAVGKRVINQGGTRIRRYVVETPVEENVTLHSERVVLDRHPVTDGQVGADSFTDKTIEMTESSEEAVVSKTARVYEEVGLRKEVSDRVETVRDTVRKEEAEIVQVPATETTVKGTMSTTGTTTPGTTTPGTTTPGTTTTSSLPPKRV